MQNLTSHWIKMQNLTSIFQFSSHYLKGHITLVSLFYHMFMCWVLLLTFHVMWIILLVHETGALTPGIGGWFFTWGQVITKPLERLEKPGLTEAVYYSFGFLIIWHCNFDPGFWTWLLSPQSSYPIGATGGSSTCGSHCPPTLLWRKPVSLPPPNLLDSFSLVEPQLYLQFLLLGRIDNNSCSLVSVGNWFYVTQRYQTLGRHKSPIYSGVVFGYNLPYALNHTSSLIHWITSRLFIISSVM
jgi:hypothetical protein